MESSGIKMMRLQRLHLISTPRVVSRASRLPHSQRTAGSLEPVLAWDGMLGVERYPRAPPCPQLTEEQLLRRPLGAGRTVEDDDQTG